MNAKVYDYSEIRDAVHNYYQQPNENDSYTNGEGWYTDAKGRRWSIRRPVSRLSGRYTTTNGTAEIAPSRMVYIDHIGDDGTIYYQNGKVRRNDGTWGDLDKNRQPVWEETVQAAPANQYLTGRAALPSPENGYTYPRVSMSEPQVTAPTATQVSATAQERPTVTAQGTYGTGWGETRTYTSFESELASIDAQIEALQKRRAQIEEMSGSMN